MLLLEQSGDRVGAIRAYDELAKSLERDIGVEPATETRALHEAIRARDVPIDHKRLSPVAPAAIMPGVGGGATVVQPPQPPGQTFPWQPAPRQSILRRAVLTTGSLAAAIALVWGATRVTTSGPKTDPAKARKLAELPFASSDASRPAAESIFARVESAIDTMPAIRVIGKRAVARFSLAGEVVTIGDELQLRVQLFDTLAGSDPVVRSVLSGAVGEGPRLADDLAWQLGVIAASMPATLDPTGTTNPVVQAGAALDAIRNGETAYRDGRFSEAVREFRRAIDADTGNAQAYYSLSEAANWSDQSELASWGANMALQRVATVSPVKQFLIRGWHEYLAAHPRDAERLLRLVVASAPGDINSNFTLGEVRFHWGPGLGWPYTEAEQSFALVDSSVVRSTASIIHLARLAGMNGDPEKVDALVARALATRPDAGQTLELRALRAFAGSGGSEVESVLRDVERASETVAQSVATYVAVTASENDRAQRVLDIFSRPGRSPSFRAMGAVLRSTMLSARGRNEALASLASDAALPPSRVAEFRAAVGILPFNSLPKDSLASLRAALARVRIGASTSLYDAAREPATYRRVFLLGILSSRMGDRQAAMSYVDTLERPPMGSIAEREFRTSLARIVRATVLQSDGKLQQALDVLGEPRSSPDFVIPDALSYPVAAERFLRAELLHSLGRNAAALRWYGTFPDPGGYDLAYLAPSLLRRAEIATKRGDQAAAQKLRTRAMKLWSSPSPEFRPWLDRAQGGS
jgi:tetratricopeptide (TPR) repeat protein